jgi:UTP--glucose-1-phosphate uridylyltransferase
MGKLTQVKAFENTSTSIAASQMRNALTALADTVEEGDKKKVECPKPLFK